MGSEQSKATKRRFDDGLFHSRYFVGEGIDIGGGSDSLEHHSYAFRMIKKVDTWDVPQGDAQYMIGVKDNRYDFVHSSHCLEHMVDPYTAFKNWIRITKPGGFLIVTVPEEKMYERGIWPSKSNSDHKWSFVIGHSRHSMSKSISILEFLYRFSEIDVEKIELISDFYDARKAHIDQTAGKSITECAIEFVVRKI